MENKYIPRPIETTNIRLEQHLQQLTEVLAEHAHDLWAFQRISEGWQWGEHRCDHQKTHPCLIPYENLPENEKEYDRHTAVGTLKAIVAMGYTIGKPTGEK